MKKIIKSATFWFFILSLLTILNQQLGFDSHSIMLIWFNPILNFISKSNLADFMNSGPQIPCKNLLYGDVSLYWYIGCIISFLIYGIIIDGIRKIIKNLKNHD